jgi:hypothetical protein
MMICSELFLINGWAFRPGILISSPTNKTILPVYSPTSIRELHVSTNFGRYLKLQTKAAQWEPDIILVIIIFYIYIFLYTQYIEMAELAKAYPMDKITSAGTTDTPTVVGGETSKYESNLIKGGKKDKNKKLVKGGNKDKEMKDKDMEGKEMKTEGGDNNVDIKDGAQKVVEMKSEKSFFGLFGGKSKKVKGGKKSKKNKSNKRKSARKNRKH